MFKKVLFSLLSIIILTSCQTNNNDSKSNAKIKDSSSAYKENQLLDQVQKQTFLYFWDGAEPHSGLARERIHIDGEYPQNDQSVITIGGSGFGLMSILIGVHNGYITKQEAIKHLQNSLNFLAQIDRFQGAWAHWYYGDTGKVKAFSEKDNGGDIVETAFMAQALITVREYFNKGNAEEIAVAKQADSLWRGINWDFYRNGDDLLYWHWSPTEDWGMNHAIQGFDECLIAYVLGASSPTHPIPVETYHKGWARDGAISSGIEKYDIPTVLKHNSKEGEVGPLFWSHYSFLGLNPKGLKDQYANYEEVVTNHTKINIAHAEANPQQFKGYGRDKGWGWSASYSTNGYNAHHPDNDPAGVISPTAALSSIAYTPTESILFMKYLKENLNDKLWGKYGFYDAYSETENWYPQRYLAIDQGPIVVMIQNYKDSFIWDLFMNAPEIQTGLKTLNFQSPYLK
ncbi:beta-glucosidase [Sphingobacterium sp. UT-1RO-CII-1]|uniref:glucoamylase family protein n=1 Tax=Sphingobacterium sp. UT-1RO-CII-1 TaxID=2995225 RepID=UPI00227CFCD1|nr:glucoamylase family protein [Sphingobacterium sp. UT-1RO-CII-1]MCY4778972.1 beta-glucosidase [Sphingobacterium sp. UT-1RO-CII-1]